MSRTVRLLTAVVCLAATTVILVATPSSGIAALGDCSEPVTNGTGPTASDCLFILKAAIGSEVCSPECICAPKGTLPITAVDALVCLKFAVGQSVELTCPCLPTTTITSTTIGTPTTTTTVPPTTTIPSSTTITSTSSTTIVIVTTSTTSTTTTTLVPCTIDSAICTESACSCGVLPGIDYHVANSSGSITGGVGSRFDVNINVAQGGQLDCGGWTRIDASVQAGCNTIGCCRHDAGQPDTVTWNVFEVIDMPCTCPSNPFASELKHNLLIQCFFAGGGFVEREQQSTGCP